MNHRWSTRFVPILVVLAALSVACSSRPRVKTTPMATPEPAAAPVRPSVPEEVVEPTTAPIPSEEVSEELPQDIQELNRRGYLQDVFFDTDKYDLKPEVRDALAKNAAWLQQHPSVRLVVEGHCDERNTREYNVALGERRAGAVRGYLVMLGVPGERMTTVSYGEERPFALGHEESAWRLNRRAHFLITGR